jgi:hypothetical protein
LLFNSINLSLVYMLNSIFFFLNLINFGSKNLYLICDFSLVIFKLSFHSLRVFHNLFFYSLLQFFY